MRHSTIFSQPVPRGYRLGQRVRILFIYMFVCVAFISSSSASPSSLEEGSSGTCVGAVPRDLSHYDIKSGITNITQHIPPYCLQKISGIRAWGEIVDFYGLKLC